MAKPITSETLLEIVCTITGHTPEELKSQSRDQQYADARHIFSAIAWRLKLERTYAAISRHFNRKPGCAFNSVKVVDELRFTNKRFRSLYTKVMDRVMEMELEAWAGNIPQF